MEKGQVGSGRPEEHKKDEQKRPVRPSYFASKASIFDNSRTKSIGLLS
jgi:hypothetical protein